MPGLNSISARAAGGLIVFLWGGVASPAGSQNAEKPYPAQSRVVEGVKILLNPEFPRDGVRTPKCVEVWSVGGETDPRGELINRPQDLRVSADGTVYVLDWQDGCVRVFDAGGQFVRQVGRPGQGPGDINTPCWIDLGPRGELFVLDGRNMRVSRFAQDGTFVKSFRVEKYSATLRADGAGRLYRGEESTVDSAGLSGEYKEIIRSITVVRTDAEGMDPKRFGPFVGQRIFMKSEGQGVISLSSPFTATTGWGVDRDGRLYAGHNEKYEVAVHDPEGKILFRFGRKFKPVRNPRFKPSAAFAQPETLPAFNPEFFFDETGEIWLPLYRGGDKESFLYDVFSPEGIYLKQIIVPFRVYRVRGGKAYAIVESEEGFRVIKCFRLAG